MAYPGRVISTRSRPGTARRYSTCTAGGSEVEKEALHVANLESVIQLGRREVIVLDGVPGAGHLDPLEARNRAEVFHLYRRRQRSRKRGPARREPGKCDPTGSAGSNRPRWRTRGGSSRPARGPEPRGGIPPVPPAAAKSKAR